MQQDERHLILMLDEFDEAFASLDGRVFLNLRGLRDRFRHNLIYVTANVRHLGTFRTATDSGEFVELSEANTYVIHPFQEDAAGQAINALAETQGKSLSNDQLQFLLSESGGHPGLINAATLTFLRQSEAARNVTFDAIQQTIDNEKNTIQECSKIWRQLLLEEQETCLTFVSKSIQSLTAQEADTLLQWGLLRGDPPVLFSAIFQRFLLRQTIHTTDIPGGLVVDADAGDVWLDSQQVPPLTDLEFRLLRLLYERQGKLTDKYQIVQTVWGEELIDEVEDTRIEKLISRLRGKIEPDPGNPRYLTTVRGRGYKLNVN